MPKRLFLILCLTLMPVTALADDATGTDPNASPPAAEVTPAPSSTTAPAAGLGPDASVGAGSSTAASGSLQPAGNSPLQSTRNDSTGLAAPANALQAPAAGNADLQVLAGEGDGPQHGLSGDEDTNRNLANWLISTLILAALFAGGIILFRDRRNYRLSEHPDHKAQAAGQPEAPEPAAASTTQPEPTATSIPEPAPEPESKPTAETEPQPAEQPNQKNTRRNRKRRKK
jgi:hypothetical protein